MRVFNTYAELQDAMESGSFLFLPEFMPAGFVCQTCKKTIQFPMQGAGTGYGLDYANRMHCYACCEQNERNYMERETVFTGYLSSDGKHFTTWTGGVLGAVTRETESRTGWHGSTLTHVRIRDWIGREWHGKGSGRGMVLRVHRCKGK
jgi:hypothetical protein